MGIRTSVHGRALGFDQNFIYLHGRPYGDGIVDGGKRIYVDSAVAGSSGESPDTAMSTLQAAIDKLDTLTLDNTGATIVIMPNHAETITGASGLTFDVAGIRVIGLGHGNQRPRFLMDGGTSVTALVSAADVYIENLVFAGGHASIVTCFDITGVNCHLNNVEFEDNTTSEFFLVCVKATGAANTADGLKITNCKRYTVEAATDFFTHTEAVNGLVMTNNTYIADAATGAGLILSATTKVLTGLVCLDNIFICGNTAGDILIDNDATTNTGVVGRNLVGHHDVAAVIIVDCDGVRQFLNYSTGSDTESGVLMPAADSLT